VLPTCSLLPALFEDYLPLSMSTRTGQRTTQSLFVVLAMIPVMALAMLAWFAQDAGQLWALVALQVPVMIALHLMLLRAVEARSVRSSRLAPGRVPAPRRAGMWVSRWIRPRREE